MACTRRIRQRLAVYVEELATPLETLTKAFRVLTYAPTIIYSAITSQTAKHFWQGLSQTSLLGKMTSIAWKAKETNFVIVQTLKSNFLYTAFPMMVSTAFVRPVLREYFPYIHVPIYLYLSLFLYREAARRLFLYAPIYNMCLSQALAKDLESAIAKDIDVILRKNFLEEMDLIFNELSTNGESRVLRNDFEAIFYNTLSAEIAKKVVKVFTQFSTAAFSGDRTNTTHVFFLELVKSLTEYSASGKPIEQINHLIEDRLASDVSMQTDKEIRLKYFFKMTANRLITSFSIVSMKQFVDTLWQRINKQTSYSYDFLGQLPSMGLYAKPHSVLEMANTYLMFPFYGLVNILLQNTGYGVHTLVGKGLEAYLTGYILLNTKFATVGMGKNERFDLLSRNKAYTWGLGAGVLGILDLAVFGFSFLPGGGSWVIPLALYYPLLQLCSMSSILQNHSLPGKEAGFDLFSLTRPVADQLFNGVVASLRNPAFRKQCSDFFSHPCVLDARKLIAGGKLKSANEIIKNPAFNLFLKLYGLDAMEGLKHIEGEGAPLLTKVATTAFLTLLGIDERSYRKLIQKFKEIVILADRHRQGLPSPIVENVSDDLEGITHQLKKWQEEEASLQPGSVIPESILQLEYWQYEQPDAKETKQLEQEIRDNLKQNLSVASVQEPSVPIPKKEVEVDFDEFEMEEAYSSELSPLREGSVFPVSHLSAGRPSEPQLLTHRVRVDHF